MPWDRKDLKTNAFIFGLADRLAAYVSTFLNIQKEIEKNDKKNFTCLIVRAQWPKVAGVCAKVARLKDKKMKNCQDVG